MKQTLCSGTIVVYNNDIDTVRNAATSFLSCSHNVELHVVDNSPAPTLKAALADLPLTYHFTGSNLGYGRAHNLIINGRLNSHFHVIINPDISIGPSVIETLSSFLNQNASIAMVCPKVLNEDGSIQPLNKRYPTVFDLFARRFAPNFAQPFLAKRLSFYESHDLGYDSIRDVEFMTGCFMFCRTSVLKAVGGFDPRYFMYFEDCDLGRKIQNAGHRTVYYPDVSVTHLWERASHKSLRMTLVLVTNMVRYFNKWGWKLY